MLRMPFAFGAGALALTLAIGHAAYAQVGGGVDQTVGGTPFMEAAEPSPDTADFHSDDGRLTFAIISHTAGNGFFDPAYVGAQVAADAFGINLIKLGPEAPIDDYPRQFEIINQVLQDPTIDGLAITTGQAGAYDDVVAKARELGIPVATLRAVLRAARSCSPTPPPWATSRSTTAPSRRSRPRCRRSTTPASSPTS